jgi:beta-phosphoglucomutase-like phosphatase (HAD superfamily)
MMRTVIGLPSSISACLFDLDGVLTETATVHAAAWKEMLDADLRARAERTGEPFVPFDRVGQAKALRQQGTNLVVTDLAQLLDSR